MVKFDVVVGNPPYQEEIKGTSAQQIYPLFMDAAYDVADKTCLITPGRFLFNAGKTPKKWNDKMLNSDHLKVIHYEGDSNKVFHNTSITGGVAITYQDRSKCFGKIGTFISYSELRSIVNKVTGGASFSSVTSIIYNQNRFNLEALYIDYPNLKNVVGSDGKERRLTSNSFNFISAFKCMDADKVNNDTDVKVLGLSDQTRTYKYINKKYLEHEDWLDCYKVFVPGSNGASGTLSDKPARMISKPVIGKPNEGMTQTFIGFGKFTTYFEAESCFKYIKSKFTRVLLGALKVTQSNKPQTWAKVPLQDFTKDSDIDWSKTIPEIDQQLYEKYGLSEEEITFIETHVKEMD